MGVIMLVRHGQASTGQADYDRLSPLGEQQASVVGAELRARDLEPSIVLCGSLRRQQQTAKLASDAAGWQNAPATDAAWNEFDHTEVIGAVAPAAPSVDRAQSNLDHAIPRWSSGLHDADYHETFRSFSSRTEAAFAGLTPALGRGESAVVFSSAGVIARICADLLDGGEPQWRALNRIVVNSSITTISVGSRGATLLTFNEHRHLPRPLVTYA